MYRLVIVSFLLPFIYMAHVNRRTCFVENSASVLNTMKQMENTPHARQSAEWNSSSCFRGYCFTGPTSVAYGKGLELTKSLKTEDICGVTMR